MACEVTATDAAHHFQLMTDFITDPAAEAVVIRVSLVPLPGAPSGLSVYLRFNPLLNGHGGGGSANFGGAVGHGRVHRPRAGSCCPTRHQLVHRGGEPQLRLAQLCRAGRQHPVRRGADRVRRDGQRRADPARLVRQELTPAAPDADNGNVVQTVKLGSGGGSVT